MPGLTVTGKKIITTLLIRELNTEVSFAHERLHGQISNIGLDLYTKLADRYLTYDEIRTFGLFLMMCSSCSLVQASELLGWEFKEKII